MSVQITSKNDIETYMRQDIFLHLYEIGDLDDFFFPNTTWFALSESDTTKSNFIALLYADKDCTVLLAHGRNIAQGQQLLAVPSLALPDKFMSQLAIGLSHSLADRYVPQFHGVYLKMAFFDKKMVANVDTTGVIQLTQADLNDILEFYTVSYPQNWFNPRTLETGQNYGIRDSTGKLIAMAGVHVYSASYSVCALGNIATHPEHRRQGLAKRVSAALTKSLIAASITNIGLNVFSTNLVAIACYRKIGFEVVGEFEEILWQKKTA